MDMDVPFVSSGAMSRAHYTLVRKVETAPSIPSADQYLLSEIESVRHRLADRALSLKRCKECLLLLLYCSMTASPGCIVQGELDFAFPHAVNLAEAGQTLHDRRAGYLFCCELMPRNHGLQLMLVNTLRKDLESTAVPRICLALDVLVSSPTEDVIPAIQSRLHDLLSHNSSHVRRRAIWAIRALSRFEPELLKRTSGIMQKRLVDPDTSVATAALRACPRIIYVYKDTKDQFFGPINEILKTSWSRNLDRSGQWLLINVLVVLRSVGITTPSLRTVHDIIRYTSNNALLYSAFLLLADIPPETQLLQQVARPRSPVQRIRQLLTSTDCNEQYIFLACLECLDPADWAGTIPGIPAILEGWEVERVMQLLNSRDQLIRKKTLRILCRVDSGIISSYFSQALGSIPTSGSVHDRNDYACSLLEVAELLCCDTGEVYAQLLKQVLFAAESNISIASEGVLELVVDRALSYIREASQDFCVSCVTTLAVAVTDEDLVLGPTFMVICSALITEYGDKVSVSPLHILRGTSVRLFLYVPTVQDACLLCMLRISALCEEVPSDVTEKVTMLMERAGRHIRRRCDQFIHFSRQKDALRGIMSNARSSSLPDFLEALNGYLSLSSVNSPALRTISPAADGTSSHPHVTSSSRLRYAAYDSPRAVTSLRQPRTPRYSSSASGSQPDVVLSRGSSRLSHNSEGRSSLDELSRTVTAGDLALAVGGYLEMSPKPSFAAELQEAKGIDDTSGRADLIAFDSPFVPDTQATSANAESTFEIVWNGLEGSNARGWCEMSSESIIQQLEGMEYQLEITGTDQAPFEGDLKVVISGEGTTRAALRLKESDENSCLWRLRCEDDGMRTSIKRFLMET